MNKIIIIILCVLLFIFLFKKSTKENFLVWNIPTRGILPIYDVRGYPPLDRYPYYPYYPIYNNGMLYFADGKYNYDIGSRINPLYYTDYLGLVNNGIIKPINDKGKEIQKEGIKKEIKTENK